MVRLMRSALPNRGTRMSAARTALSKKTEMARARRFNRRPRLRCSASPSTRHALNDPRLSLGLACETLRGSGDITDLHNFFRERPPLCRPTTGLQKNLRRRFPGGCSRSPRDRRRARRDVRLRASSLRWTPRVQTSSRGCDLSVVRKEECGILDHLDHSLTCLE
jgi:hypothetical protein